MEKKYSTYSDSSWVQQSKRRFVYDDWNVVMLLNGASNNAIFTKYTWGLDMSGLSGNTSAAGIHGAGGIGGLLAVEETAATGSPSYWFLYDGNGNVGQVLKASDQSLAAKYEYDPYGNPQSATGDYAATNPFRFSTKWLDSEVDYPNTTADGLYYYGYRYYSPRLGRWMNRDPMEEKGGFNLYGHLLNAPIADNDPIGTGPLSCLKCLWKLWRAKGPCADGAPKCDRCQTADEYVDCMSKRAKAIQDCIDAIKKTFKPCIECAY